MKYIKSCIVASLVVVMVASTTYALDDTQLCVAIGKLSLILMESRFDGMSEEGSHALVRSNRAEVSAFNDMADLIVPEVYKVDIRYMDRYQYSRVFSNKVFKKCMIKAYLMD